MKLSVCVGDGSWCSEEIVKKLELCLSMRLLLLLLLLMRPWYHLLWTCRPVFKQQFLLHLVQVLSDVWVAMESAVCDLWCNSLSSLAVKHLLWVQEVHGLHLLWVQEVHGLHLLWVQEVHGLHLLWVQEVHGLHLLWVQEVRGLHLLWVQEVHGLHLLWVQEVYGLHLLWVQEVHGLQTKVILLLLIIMAFKGAIRDNLQSPHCAANQLQHVGSSGPSAIVCKSRATHRALITCNMSYYLVQRDSWAVKFDRV